MPTIISVSRDDKHRFSKPVCDSIRLIAGLGVEGDTHLGITVQHRSRWAKYRDKPNLRQVHLLHEELLTELAAGGFDIAPGAIGENVTTRGIDLLALPTGTRLQLGAEAVVEVTGLRNPCIQLDRYRDGLMQAMLGRDEAGGLVRKSGVMAIVLAGGEIRPGDVIGVTLPDGPQEKLQPV